MVSMRETTFYAFSLYAGYTVWGSETWIYDPKYMWSLQEMHVMTVSQRLLYLLELSWYMCGILRLCIEPKKKDFKQMLFHHFFTVGLLGLSYQIKHIRIGVVVYMLHNIADPFLQVAKLCKYSGSEVGATLFFIPFALSFFVTRLVVYPYVVYYTIFYGPGYVRGVTHVSEAICMALLSFLIPIHMFWFYLIARIAIKAVADGGKSSDNRSDSEDDDYVVDKKDK